MKKTVINFHTIFKNLKKNFMKSKILIFIFLIFSVQVFACTTILVTKKASKDGSVMVAQSFDDEAGDQRIVYVPAKNHRKGSKRPIFPYKNNFPRYVGKSMGPAYNVKGLKLTKPLGYIAQVEHTYAYFDGGYGLINEYQLGIGESTCASYYNLYPSKDRMFDIRALTHIALERCKTAREAIKLMGYLAEKYGYYGFGETLTVGDTEEGWAFEISGTPSGKGALWVAKKVPDGEIYICPNIFRIREIDPKDPNTMYSKSLFKTAKAKGWWDPKKGKQLDWLKMISPGEYDHPYYSLRRLWRIQTKLNPALNLSAWVKDAFTREYPFSIKPDKKLTVRDVISLYRDQYEGTEFDMTKGLAAGPFGNPNRYYGPYDHKYNETGYAPVKIKGAWERPVSIYFNGFTFVNQLRKILPNAIGGVCWVAFDISYCSCFIPLYIGVSTLPNAIQNQNPTRFDESNLWPICNLASNWATLKYSYMIKDIQKKQKALEDLQFNKQNNIEKKALSLYKKNPKLARKFLTKYCIKNTYFIKDQWWDLTKYLIAKYADGYINIPTEGTEVGYPRWWRDKVGYKNGPTTYEKK